MSLASLPWYDLPETREATDTFWRGIARHARRQGLTDVPERLTRHQPLAAQWRSADLLMSQACGYNVVSDYAHVLQVVATPCYSAVGCRDGSYRSFIVVHAEARYQDLAALRGSVCAVNSLTSHSGNNALYRLIEPMLDEDGTFFSNVKITGSHVASLKMIAAREADVASIDCITYALLERHRPWELAAVRKFAFSEAAPAPPYVTGMHTSPGMLERLRAALHEAMEDPTLGEVRQTLLLGGVTVLNGQAYKTMLQSRPGAPRPDPVRSPGVVSCAESAEEAVR